MTVYFVWLFWLYFVWLLIYLVRQYCRTVLFTISSDTIQNMFSTLVQNLKKKYRSYFVSKKDLFRHRSIYKITGSITIGS